MSNIEETIAFIRGLYKTEEFIPLHAPVFLGREKEYLNNCINSTFVSSVGEYVDKFEKMLCEYTGASFSIATVNGTAALHSALVLAGVKRDDEVLTQSLTFVATANAISYTGALPVFVDSERSRLSMDPLSLREFLSENCVLNERGECINIKTKKVVRACVPMHTFGHPADMDSIVDICKKYNIFIIEDAAESIGSFTGGKHTGLKGDIGILSFNGNKVVTAGGGGAIICNNENLAKKAKHVTTTARVIEDWSYSHDEIGFNYRMPNINAALVCAQLEKLPEIIKNKRETASLYKKHFESSGIQFVDEPENCQSNFWLNAIALEDKKSRDEFLKLTNDQGVMTRPLWMPMHRLEIYKNFQKTSMENTDFLWERIVNLPSSFRPNS